LSLDGLVDGQAGEQDDRHGVLGKLAEDSGRCSKDTAPEARV
jgi:hypothetical protein